MYRFDKETNDLIIDGWEQGIAASPHKGLANLQCGDISTIPGEISVNFARFQQTQIPVVAQVLLVTNGQLDITVATGGPLLVGIWIQITDGGAGNIPNGYYYVNSVSGSNPQVINISATFEGTSIIPDNGLTLQYSTVNLGEPIAWTRNFIQGFPESQYIVLDSNGYVWVFSFNTSIYKSPVIAWRMFNCDTFAGPDVKGGTSGIATYGEYIIIAADQLYYKAATSNTGLGTAWATFAGNTTLLGSSFRHYMLVGQDEVLYWTDQNTLGSLTVIAGQDSNFFNPADTSTYTIANSGSGGTGAALTFPQSEIANTIAELGVNLFIGMWSANLYSWNRTPIEIGNGQALNSFFFPIFLPETYTQQLLTINNILYVFCGSKGNIYVTDGSRVSAILTIPDSTTNQIEPYYIWGGVMYLRGRIWFGIQDSNNTIGGIWSFVPSENYYIEQDTGVSLRLEGQNSSGTYQGMTSLLIPVVEMGSQYVSQTPGQQVRGAQYWSGWTDGGESAGMNPFGIDFSSTSPYTGNQCVIETDAIPVGTFFNKSTDMQFEYKLATALATGESVQINWRTDLQAPYSSGGPVVKETTTTDGSGTIVSGYFSNNLQNAQWLQLQIILKSTISAPSFVRLKEIRVR